MVSPSSAASAAASGAGVANGTRRAYRHQVQSIRRPWHALLGALIAIFLAVPATAWDVHGLVHLSAPVAADEHHHHDDYGAIDVHHDPAGPSAEHQDDDGSHDHLPSLAAAWTGFPSQGPLLVPPPAPLMPHILAEGRAPPDPGSDPQIRPPRFA